MKEDCVAVLSGGLDSTVMTYRLVNEGRTPLLVTFTYGQRHDKEILMAKRTAEKLGLSHLVLSLPLDNIFSSSSLLKGGKDIPVGTYSVENQKSTVVPNRNMILLSICAGIAEDRGLSKVYYGAHKNDTAVYPDCRPEFIRAVSAATEAGTYCRVQVIAPFMDFSKADIVSDGARLRVPFEDTWSCYSGGETACGMCGTCVERREAFRAAGIQDPGDM